MPDGDVLLFSLVVDGHVGRLVDFSRLKYQHLEEQKTAGWSLSHSRVHVFQCLGMVVCTGKRRRLVVPCVASTMMSIQKLSLSRWGEWSTICFLNR